MALPGHLPHFRYYRRDCDLLYVVTQRISSWRFWSHLWHLWSTGGLLHLKPPGTGRVWTGGYHQLALLDRAEPCVWLFDPWYRHLGPHRRTGRWYAPCFPAGTQAAPPHTNAVKSIGIHIDIQ